MEVDVYFDESGDLGWTLDQPYRKGGSSRYFTIAYIILPADKNKYINRFLRKFNKSRNSSKEVKGAKFSNGRAKVMAKDIMKLLDIHSDILIGSITAKKSGVPAQIVNSGNDDVLYNHMVQQAICSKLPAFSKVNIIPDKRSVPTGSQNSCSDLIKHDLWMIRGASVEIAYRPEESHHNERLMFIDWIANFVWRYHEDGHAHAYSILGRKLIEDTLFF